MGFYFNFILFAALSQCSFIVYGTEQVSDNIGQDYKWLDGQHLIELGRKYNKPVLTLVGLALRRYHRCTEWTDWSTCIVQENKHFGSRTRQRDCRQNPKNNKGEGEKKVENDVSLCEITCPLDYNVTKSGFCLKLYKKKVVQSEAVKQCNDDGGYLIHVDSDSKHQYVKSLLQGVGEYVFVDGRRKNLDSPWQFSYGSGNLFLQWASGQPGDATTSLCLVLDRKENMLLHDASCDNGKFFMCEFAKY